MVTRHVRVAPQTGPTTQGREPVLRTSACIKYTMFFKNMLFLLFGALLVAVGVIALQEKDKLNGQFDKLFLDPAAILLTIGAIIFLISFSGALGALRENKCLLRFFSVSIILILVLEVAVAGGVYGYREKIREKVDNVFQEMILKYHDDPDLQAVIDYVQQEVGCCGSQALDDWKKNVYFNCSNPEILSACSVPFSCCKDDTINRMCGYGVLKLGTADQQKKVYTVGCLEALENWVMDNLLYAGIVCGSLILLQLIAVWLSFRMVSDINNIIKWRDSH